MYTMSKRNYNVNSLITCKMSIKDQFILLKLLGKYSSENQGLPINMKEILSNAEGLGITPNSLRFANNVLLTFAEIGLIKIKNGNYYSSDEVVNFYKACLIDETTAAHSLKDIFMNTWYFQVLREKILEKGHLDYRTAKSILEDCIPVALSNNDKSKLGNSIAFLVDSNLLYKIGNSLGIVDKNVKSKDEKIYIDELPDERSDNILATTHCAEIIEDDEILWEQGKLTNGSFKLFMKGNIEAKDIEILIRRLSILKETL